MTHNEDANQSTTESYPLRLESTDTSYINATLIDNSVEGDIFPEQYNQPTTSTVPAIPVSFGVPNSDENNAVKKKRSRHKENIKNGNTLSTTTDSSSAAGSNKRSILGYANSPSPLQAKISDDLSTCSYLINLDTSSDAYVLDAGNDNTEGQGDSLCAENLSCSMLSCHEVLEISEDIKGLNFELLKRDEYIEKLAKSLEVALKDKEEQEKEVTRLANNIQIVQHELNKFTVHTSSQFENIRGQQFELSSYLSPPNERSFVNTPLVPETKAQFCQTDGTTYKSVGVTCKSLSIEPAVVQQNCHNLQLSSQNLRSEVAALKLFVSDYFESMKRINGEDIVRSVTNLYHKQNEDLVSIKAQYSEDSSYQTNLKIQLEEEIKNLKIMHHKELEMKNEEIHSLIQDSAKSKEQFEEFKLQQENDVQTIQLANEGVLKNKNNEIQALNAKMSRLEETIKNSKTNEKNEVERIKQKHEDILKSKNEEIRCLHLKLSKMEEAKRNDQKLNSMVSRLSPEGSELESEQMLNDTTSSVGNHFHLTRTKMDYLKLTPPVECIDDGEILEQSSASDVPNSIIEDLKLQLLDVEKKFDANRKYLDEQTFEREQERDEFHKAIESLQLKIEDLKKEKDRLNNIIANQKLEIGDYETRLRDAVNTEQDLIRKGDRGDEELKTAVDKIFELREIIRDLEEQIDTATVNALELKDQNQLLSDELDRLEIIKRDQEDALQTTQDTIYTLGGDMVEELQTQIQDLTRRLEKKLNEMDNFPWQTRPNSSCSGAISVSTEDVSVREFSYLNRDKECDPKEAGSLLCDGLRRLDTHFDNLVRFEEVIVKKLQDAEMRLSHAKQRYEEMENERIVYQENIKSQINKIADLESRLDQFRFEPSPSVVTLSGLRARVTALTEECEQYKGNLQLRTIELQDANVRLVATQAMFEKYKSMAARNATSRVDQNSVQTQMRVNMNESYSQTEKIVDKLSTSEASVQTNEIVLEKKGDEFMYFNRPFEVSAIPGGPAPTYSTPNEILNIQKSSIKTKTHLGNSWTLLGAGDSDLSRTPEVGRNRIYPSALAFSNEKSLDRFSNKSVSFNIKELERGENDPGVGDDFLQDAEDRSESSRGGTGKNASDPGESGKRARGLTGEGQTGSGGSGQGASGKNGSGRGMGATRGSGEGMAVTDGSGQGMSKKGGSGQRKSGGEGMAGIEGSEQGVSGRRSLGQRKSGGEGMAGTGGANQGMSEKRGSVQRNSGGEGMAGTGGANQGMSEKRGSVQRNSGGEGMAGIEGSEQGVSGRRSLGQRKSGSLSGERMAGIESSEQGMSGRSSVQRNSGSLAGEGMAETGGWDQEMSERRGSGQRNSGRLSGEERSETGGWDQEMSERRGSGQRNSGRLSGEERSETGALDQERIEKSSSRRSGSLSGEGMGGTSSNQDASKSVNVLYPDDGESTSEGRHSTYEDDIYSASSVERMKQQKPADAESSDDFFEDDVITSEVRETETKKSTTRSYSQDKIDPIEERTSEYKDEQIEKLVSRIKELEDLMEKEKPIGDDYNKYMLETEIEFDKDGVTPITGRSGVREGYGDIEEGDLETIKSLIEKIEKTSALPDFSDEETTTLVRALKDRIALRPQYKASVKKVGDDSDAETYAYQVQAVTDYAVDDDGKRRHIKTELLNGEDRIQDTDKQITIETIKTQMDQLKQALCIERAKCQQLATMLSQATGQSVEALISGLKIEGCGISSTDQASTSRQPIERLNEFVQERDSNNQCLQNKIDSLSRQLEERIQNEFSLANKLETTLAYLRQKQMEQDHWISAAHSYEAEIQRLKTQLEVAAEQVRRKQADGSYNSTARQSANGINYLELYLKARSFRKALIWQKKYLMLVIQGYKDILRASGLAYDPDLLQKTIPIAPSSVGLVDRNRKYGRFRIVARAIVALCRMKYMVSRWKSKSSTKSIAVSNMTGQNTPGAATPPFQLPNTVSDSTVLSPPTKEGSNTKLTVGTSVTTIPLVRHSGGSSRRRSSLNPRFPSATATPIEFSNAPSTSSVPRPTASGNNVLSQYLDRFEYLENELGSSLGRETNRPPEEDEDE